MNTKTNAGVGKRVADPGGLDYYPTPDWVTEALVAQLYEDYSPSGQWDTCLEPAAGGGHMARVLARTFNHVTEQDIADHNQRGVTIADYTKHSGAPYKKDYDWVITNPPFRHFTHFALNAIRDSKVGAAMFGRLSVLEGQARYANLWQHHPPSRVLVFSERVTFDKGEIATTNNSSISFAWYVWERNHRRSAPAIYWLPPGTRP